MKTIIYTLFLFTICNIAFAQGDITIPATNSYKYDSPKTEYLAVSYTAFNATDADEYSFVFNTFTQPYKYFRDGTGAFGYASAPIYFPDGVTVTKITAYVMDNTTTEFLRLRLISTPYGGTNTVQSTIQTTSASSSSSVQSLEDTISLVIDNSSNSYQFRFESSDSNTSDIRLYGVKIEYTTDKVQ